MHWLLPSFPMAWQSGNSVLIAAAEVGSIALFDWLVETFSLNADQWSEVSNFQHIIAAVHALVLLTCFHCTHVLVLLLPTSLSLCCRVAWLGHCTMLYLMADWIWHSIWSRSMNVVCQAKPRYCILNILYIE